MDKKKKDLAVKSYKQEGFINYRKGISSTPRDIEIELHNDIYKRKSPLINTIVSKGTVTTNFGGLVEFKDATGGTVIFTYDPDTGVVTISGSVVANQTLNLGTLTSPAFAGTVRNLGTMTNSGTISGGIINPGTVQSGVFNNITIGTPEITNGTSTNHVLTTPTINNAVIGTPLITNGSMNSATFGTPTIIRPTIDGTMNLDVNAGSSALGVNGDFAIQTFGTAGVLVYRVNGTSFFIGATGTL